MFTHRLRYWFIAALSLYTYVNTELCDVYKYFGISIERYYAIATIFLITLFVWEGNRLIEKPIKKFFPPEKGSAKYLVSFFLIGSSLSFFFATIIVLIIGMLLNNFTWQQTIMPLKLNLIYTGLVSLLFHLINTIFYFFKEYKKQWMEAEELRRNSTQAQLQLIKNQVNPHFLFNNLNVLSSLLIKDNPEANQFIEEFSKVYRYILNNQDKELVELQSELEFIKPYIFLLKKRFDNGLEVDLNIPEHYKKSYVIPVALQILIENAIKHNVVSKARPLHIVVHVNEDDTLVVTNNLQPRQTTEPSTRIGLQNIRKRYQIICGKAIDIQHTDKEFAVTIPLLHLN